MQLESKPGFPNREEPGLFWLGQAGFWIETGQHSILIDPYLSDSLARKYAGQKNDHQRMMAPPCAVEDLPKPDLVLITHAHTDHMDPETLAPLSRRFPNLPFVVPAACQDVARQRIGAAAPLILANADEALAPLQGLTLQVFPAAHEDLSQDALGQFLFLGFGITSAGIKIYHSGDCVPFDGLDRRVQDFAPDIALLPVNGRDKARLAAGVPGNFTLEEARALARFTPVMVAHHFGMFAFNTCAPERIEEAAAAPGRSKVIRPRIGETLSIKAG